MIRKKYVNLWPILIIEYPLMCQKCICCQLLESESCLDFNLLNIIRTYLNFIKINVYLLDGGNLYCSECVCVCVRVCVRVCAFTWPLPALV